MTKTQTIQNADELIAQLPRQIHGRAASAEYIARRKTAEKEITEKYQQYRDELAALKKDVFDFKRSDAESAFAAEAEKFKTTCAALTKMRDEVMHSPRPGNTFAPTAFKVGRLYLQPATAAAREFNRKLSAFSDEYNRELKENTRALSRALAGGVETDDRLLAVNLGLEKMRTSDAGFTVRYRALEIERIKLLAK